MTKRVASTPEEIDEMLNQAFHEIEAKGPTVYPDPMEPPWDIFPEDMTSLRWRMGPGEDYRNNFSQWYCDLSDNDKCSYREKHPEPEGWQNYYSIVESRSG